ncbi:MAG TPA: YncE family protein [Terriglobales bacterium]|nr:YncE family protein [Terriglobales bacterium]
MDLVAGVSMTGVRAAAILILMLICTGCGQTYRPVATPVIVNPPNPNFAHLALVISGNGSNNPGASTAIDVSGDTAVSQSTVGLMPVHAAVVLNGSRVYVANSLDDTVSLFSPSSPTPVTTISLPAGSTPSFVATTETGTVYVANSGNNTVSAISTANNVIMPPLSGIPVGINPVALAETPNQQKLYAANRGIGGGGGSVTSINPVDRSVNQNAPITSFPWISPVSVAARSDSNRVYVLDQGSGLVSPIDTALDSVLSPAQCGHDPCNVSVGVGANFMLYDPTRNRLYVANPANNTVTYLDAASDALSAVVIHVANPISVAALPDGSRAYISTASVFTSGGTTFVTSSVTVINASDGSVRTTVPLTTAAQVCASNPSELSIVAAADSSRVYVGNCDAENVAIIQTLNDTLLLQMPAPLGASFKPDGTPLPQKPVFVVAGP